MKNPNGPSIEEIDDWNDAVRDKKEEAERVMSDEPMQSNERSYEELAERLARCLRELDHYKAELTREVMLHAITKWELKEAKLGRRP